MFQSPISTVTYTPPATPIDPLKRYLLRVQELVDLGPSRFPQPGDDPKNPTHRILWKFQMATETGEPVLDTAGQPFLHFDYTSSKLGKPKRAGGQTATARLWTEALLGRVLTDEELDQIKGDLPRHLVGKVAVALFEEKQVGGEDGQDPGVRLKIMKLGPRATPAAAPMPQSAAIPPVQAAPPPEPVAAAAPQAPAGVSLPW